MTKLVHLRWVSVCPYRIRGGKESLCMYYMDEYEDALVDNVKCIFENDTVFPADCPLKDVEE